MNYWINKRENKKPMLERAWNGHVAIDSVNALIKRIFYTNKIEAFIKELGDMVLQSYEQNDPSGIKFQSLYLSHPEIRIGLRRALVKLKKDGIIEDEHIKFVLKTAL